MEILIASFLFVIGCFIGSFLGVLIDRIPRGETVFKGRSHCESCKKVLNWHDLIPLFSFLTLGGRCRYCKVKLSWYYPFIECTTGILYVLTYIVLFSNFQFSIFNFQLIVPLAYYLFTISVLIVLFFTDLRSGIIPFIVIFPAIIVSSLFIAITNLVQLPLHLIVGLGGALFFYTLGYVTKLLTKREGMGFGDVVLAFYMGLLLLTPHIFVAYYTAFLTGGIASFILILVHKKRLHGGTIPFGPFLVTGTLISLFWGEAIFQKVHQALFM
jgi:leader peptidase (prepilin peptidase)/N-methyltransferase